MAILAPAQPATRGRRIPGSLLIAAASIAATVAALPFAARTGAPGGTLAARPAAAAPAQPLLILWPRTSPIAGTLSGGWAVRGTLAPSLPGANTIRLAVRLPSGAAATAGSLTLTATMPGMIMPPVTAVLHARGGGYTGTLALPMFGDYAAVITLRSPEGRSSGTVDLRLALPRW